jgi:hypothetical protein
MNEVLERERPATLVECPWCDGPVELRAGSSAMACDGCSLVLEVAPDRPTMAAWTRDGSGKRSWRPAAAWLPTAS